MFVFYDASDFPFLEFQAKNLPDDARIILAGSGDSYDRKYKFVFVLFEDPNDRKVYEIYETACPCCGVSGYYEPELYDLNDRSLPVAMYYPDNIDRVKEYKNIRKPVDPVAELIAAMNNNTNQDLFILGDYNA